MSRLRRRDLPAAEVLQMEEQFRYRRMLRIQRQRLWIQKQMLWIQKQMRRMKSLKQWLPEGKILMRQIQKLKILKVPNPAWKRRPKMRQIRHQLVKRQMRMTSLRKPKRMLLMKRRLQQISRMQRKT